MSMSHARFIRIMSGMSAAASKVFDVIPIAESWDLRQIVSEMYRNGKNGDPHVISGCVDTLVRSGLVNEVNKGKFRREEVKPMSSKVINIKEEEMVSTTPAKSILALKAMTPQSKPTSGPMDQLGALAARAAHLANLLKELSSDISDAAVEIQADLETNENDMQKFKQLQSLLKSIG